MTDDQLATICGFLLIVWFFICGFAIGKCSRCNEIRENARQVELISPLSY